MIDFLLGMGLGIATTVVILYFIIKRAEAHLVDNIKTIMDQLEEQTKNIISARVEQHDGVFYVYNVSDNSFIAQGNSVQEIRESIESRMKDATVLVTEGDESVLAALKETRPDA
jgi:ribosome-binding ATPase YchF (GTP1/OBG family)